MTTNENTFKFYTFNEVLPLIDATARAYAETVADTYVIGIEHKGESYPIQTTNEASEADAIVVDLQRAIDEHFGTELTVTVDNEVEEESQLLNDEEAPSFDDEESQLLEGFTFVPNKGMAQILIGKRNRLYLKGDITSQLDVTPGRRVLIAYNPAEKAFAIVKPTSKAVTDEMRAAGYFVSKRRDITCAKLFREFNLDQYEGQTFYADTASLSGNVVIFRR